MYLSMQESFLLLRRYAIPAATPVPLDESSLKSYARFPCVIKADVEGVSHKSDAGLIIANIKDRQELFSAYGKILVNSQRAGKLIAINGFPFIKGTELYVGMKRDAQFGPVITFGLGGIFVEIMKDITMAVTPFSEKEAIKMIKSIKAKKILEGARGQERVNTDAVARLIMKTQKLALKEKRIQELDFNPVIANSREAIVADIRVVV
jgi:acyl-CoA synthetase (NDP forming)